MGCSASTNQLQERSTSIIEKSLEEVIEKHSDDVLKSSTNYDGLLKKASLLLGTTTTIKDLKKK